MLFGNKGYCKNLTVAKLCRADDSPPGKLVFQRPGSVGVFQSKLNQSCRYSGARNLCKGCGRSDVDSRRSSKDWVVKEIEDIRAETERMRFAECEPLLQ